MPTKHIVFEADQGFISNAPTPPPQTYQQMMYEQRLRMGYRLLKDLPPPNENPKQALHFLAVESALVPAVGLADDHHNSNNGVHDFHRVPDMAAYICDHLLNSTAQHSFRLLLQGDKTASLHIHHSCTLILRPVVEALKVSIYLFTSKTSPFLYESDGSRGAIGIFLRASSIEQVAQFVPLVMARHTPKEEQNLQVKSSEEMKRPIACCPVSLPLKRGAPHGFVKCLMKLDRNSCWEHSMVHAQGTSGIGHTYYCMTSNSTRFSLVRPKLSFSQRNANGSTTV
ncbi:MAG: hypothetical protein J3R72DRAFT_41802 [Linnemannia gamsii]|nr:MAG: hypothetical protein J3R72DRAFT_41802 [Linnemannia gamsii]